VNRALSGVGILVLSALCVVCGGGSNPATCASACMHVAQAKCPQQQPSSEADCETNCTQQMGTIRQMGCGSKVDALLACFANVTLVCKANGSVDLSPCDKALGALNDCRNPPPPPPPGCESVPSPSPTGISCSSTETAAMATTTTCDDGSGHTWTASCDATTCSCSFDGKVMCSCADADGGRTCCPGVL
jgi:hypothetical protein